MRRNKCSRHRTVYNEKSNTPEGNLILFYIFKKIKYT